MSHSARYRAAVPLFAAAALCAFGCSTANQTEPVAQPLATVPSPPIDNDEAAEQAAGQTAASPEDASENEAAESDTARPTVSPPRQVVIPSIEIDAPIIDLGLTPDGALETPTNFDLAGWWAGGTVADEVGPTVIVGHVDDQDGPAVFFRLQELEPGDPIIVIDDLGREQTFIVVDKGLYDKTSFPTDRVYGSSDEPTLRLVTCGGEFDRSELSYESNWVVYAVSA